MIVGAPGSGKGTISNWIVRDFGLTHVSSGDLLRQHVREGSEVGKMAKQVLLGQAQISQVILLIVPKIFADNGAYTTIQLRIT